VAALWQIERSVFYSPTRATHFYLKPDLILRLSIQEREAVEEGFRMAVEHGYPGSVEGLANFYAALRLFSKEADIYAGAAATERDPQARTEYLVNAGLASLQGRDWRKAESAFRDAAATVPSDPRAYEYLTTLYGQKKDLELAKAVVSQGCNRGAEPFPLYVSLAQVQQGAGDIAGAESALLEALKYRPQNFDAAFNLGQMYLQQQNFVRAAIWFQKAAASNPRSADAFYQLGRAEEESYRYFEAEQAYARALSLAPHNAGFKADFDAFERKVREAESEHPASH
jgi:tetratricopeptide (TPR) repeat protein